jgi:hypothetical protein
MSVVNKATVRRLYEEAFAQGKPEVVDEVLDANFVCHDPNSETDISHLQVALSGFIIALGVTVIALAWYGIRHGERWALLTAFLGPVIAVAVAVPALPLWDRHDRAPWVDLPRRPDPGGGDGARVWWPAQRRTLRERQTAEERR